MPKHLLDVPMVTAINAHNPTPEVMRSLVAKLAGRSSFKRHVQRQRLVWLVGHASLTRSLCPRLQGSKVTSMTTTQEPDTRSERNYGTDPGDPARAATIGGVGETLSAEAVSRLVSAAFAEAELDGERVCLVVPDGTRTCPLPLLLQAAYGALAERAKQVKVVIALGTHQGMSEDHLGRHLGYAAGASDDTYPAGPSSTTSPGGPGPSLRRGSSGLTGSANSLVDC
jgi:hypothetical protein